MIQFKWLFLSIGLLALLVTACGGSKAKLSDPSPDSLTLTAEATQSNSATFSFSNTGEGTLNYSISGNKSWLSFSPSSGTVLPGEDQTITVTATCPSAAKTYNATITIGGNGGSKKIPLSLTCGALGFNIDLEFLGSGFTTDRERVFEAAATRWAELITGDLPDVEIPPGAIGPNQVCGFGEAAVSGVIDDIRIYATIESIDGPGNILGGASPTIVRTSNELTIIGCMQFDKDDVANLEANGSFADVILHEMGHVLGIGSLWEPSPSFNSRDLLDFSSSSGQSCNRSSNFTVKPRFNGANAVFEFVSLGGSGNVPVEDEFGQGTQCSHWDEDLFDNELMSGFLNPGSNPLSRLTAASLKDLGYTVDLDKADLYTPPNCFPNNCLRAQGSFTPWELISPPQSRISPEGKLSPYRRP